MRSIIPTACALALAGFTVSTVVSAEPRTGDVLPSVAVPDLRGTPHDTRELRGHPAVVVVLTNRHGSDMVQPWIDSARARFAGSDIRVITIVAVDLPPFATTGMARTFARRSEDPRYWNQVWLERSWVHQRLGVDDNTAPYVFGVDPSGHVVASARGTMNPQRAQSIWTAVARTEANTAAR